MDKQSYIVIDPDGLHEYTITKELLDEGLKLSLYSSKGYQWCENVRGICLLTMTDNGNGFTFNKTNKNLDYSEVNELRILLDFENAMDNNTTNREKYRIIEDKTLFES